MAKKQVSEESASAQSLGRTNGRVRRVKSGDISPTLQSAGIEKHVVAETIEAARDSKLEAVESIIASQPPHDLDSLAKSLRASLDGASPDDAALLRESLSQGVSRESADPNPDAELADDWRSGGYPYKNLLSRKSYEVQKYHLQVELLKLQAWVKSAKQKLVIVFEGRDAAGKGGTIKRFMEHLNPRGARVVALEKPSEVERGQWYFQRYVQHLPTAGEIVMLDRSWYNRAGVERVWGPGKHLAGQNMFNYFLDPSGNTMEYTTELELVDESSWEPHKYSIVEPMVADQWGTANPMGPDVAQKSFNDPDRGMFVAPPV